MSQIEAAFNDVRRTLKAMEWADLTKVCRKAGVGPSTASQIASGRTKNPGVRTVAKLHRALRLG